MSEAQTIAALEAKVDVLVEAVNSMLEWRVAGLKAYGQQMGLAGKNETNKILAQLETEPPGSWGEDEPVEGFTPISDKHLRCDGCGALVARDKDSIRAHSH